MIVLVHKNQKVIDVTSNIQFDINSYKGKLLSDVMILACKNFSDELIIWVSEFQRDNLNLDHFSKTFKHKRILCSYHSEFVIDSALGYVEQSPFIKINKEVKFPTWLMSDTVGGIYAQTFNSIYNNQFYTANFTELMCSIAKAAQPFGLLTYSEPNLLINKEKIESVVVANKIDLFSFVKKHYKFQWIFILLFNLIIYENKFPLISFLKAIVTKKINSNINLPNVDHVNKHEFFSSKVDVIIPTIGRTKYLEKVFECLANQTILPNKIIVIEQNAIQNAPTELNFIYDKTWPFKIEHQLIYQLGACNARNLALQHLEGDYVFLADDDIEFENDLIEISLQSLKSYQLEAATIACLRVGDKPFFNTIFQWGTFGSGCSLVSTNCLKGMSFDTSYEFGFGEDTDFGMRLRNKGFDIIYLPKPQVLHLKAPMGGFRTKFVHPWEKDTILPKPAPTVLLFYLKYYSKEQLLGYKTILFAKFYTKQTIKNPFKYLKIMKMRWNKSMEWANKLNA